MPLPLGFASHSSLNSATFGKEIRPLRHSSTVPSLLHQARSLPKPVTPALRFSQSSTSSSLDNFSDQLPPTPPRKLSSPTTPQTRSHAKHIPIVIPDFACPVLSTSPLTPKSDREPSISDFPLPSTVTQPFPIPKTRSRPRHVEIKIPEFIASKYLPPTPQSLDFPTIVDDTSPLHSLKESHTYSDIAHAGEDNVNFAEFVDNCLWGQDASRKDSAISFRGAPYLEGVSTTPYPALGLRTPFCPASVSKHTMHGTLVNAPGRTVQNNTSYRQNAQDVAVAANSQTNSGSIPTNLMSSTLSAAQVANRNQGTGPNLGLSGFVSNVHRTTGQEPKPLVGATTTIAGDKLFVFGGRCLSKSKPLLTSDLYELDLVRRHWTKITPNGDVPLPRYFHSICALGDSKLVCYGGMAPIALANGAELQSSTQDEQLEMGVLSDIHMFDIPTKTWTNVKASNQPEGRYAHCATILPSSAVFASNKVTASALQPYNSSYNIPSQEKSSSQIDGTGGAEMIIVGGQDAKNDYIEQISVFNLRSMTWTSTSPLDRACGAYRSVTAPLSATVASQIGAGQPTNSTAGRSDGPSDAKAVMLIYSNFNFLNVRLELQIHLSDGTLVEKPLQVGDASPPGLRFPNGGVIDNHFVVSGTFLTSVKQEYALWALDLRTLMWNRIDIGSSTFSQGSWNRGILWSRRNSFVILGNRKRSLVDDYNNRRVNFSNICVVELEAFGYYDNPRRLNPTSDYISSSSPFAMSDKGGLGFNMPFMSTDYVFENFTGGRELLKAAEELGCMAHAATELADMEFVAINGERLPANSRLVSRRWGPYFNKLMREALVTSQCDNTATLRPSLHDTAQSSRNSSITITPSMSSVNNGRDASVEYVTLDGYNADHTLNPACRPRVLFLPHTPQTIQALLYYLYTSSLPAQGNSLCSPQILCSLLQIARPYKIDGLIEAVVQRLHTILDPRNTAAIFNAAAMAAGDGSAAVFRDPGVDASRPKHGQQSSVSGVLKTPFIAGMDANFQNLSISSSTGNVEEISRPSTAYSHSITDTDDGVSNFVSNKDEVWAGSLSAVVGLQKRGLRGLMEGRRIRELGSRDTLSSQTSSTPNDQQGLGVGRS